MAFHIPAFPALMAFRIPHSRIPRGIPYRSRAAFRAAFLPALIAAPFIHNARALMRIDNELMHENILRISFTYLSHSTLKLSHQL
jgi:hypothetical protein